MTKARFGIWLLPLGIGFIVLATMNSAGYRYAASDQAFYIPAVVRHLEPAVYPRDAVLIDSQARLTVIDEAIAAAVKASGASLPHVLLVLYVVTLLLLASAAGRIGSLLFRSPWTVVALGAALTLRHAIAKTGTNTLEGYFHPRQLAFALGLWAVAMFLRRRDVVWISLLVVAALVHSTTAIWFGIWLGAAAIAGRPSWRPVLLALAGLAATVGGVLLWQGILAERLVRMDPEWLAAIGEKDLFPLAWPANVWLTNCVAIPIILLGWRARARARLTVPGETPLVIGSMALVVVFLCWLPFNHARVALAVQLQLARVFWLLDVFGTMYLVWWLCESSPSRRPQMAAAALILLSLSRGLFSLFVQFPDRSIFTVEILGDWRDAMAFAATTDPGSGWLADPVHAAKYGSSIRAAGRRDVLLEAMKDRAIAMYDRAIALRVGDRLSALDALRWDTPDGARALSRRYGLDYLVIDRELELPLAHRSGSLFIYRLR
jgi:hypothetical protein